MTPTSHCQLCWPKECNCRKKQFKKFQKKGGKKQETDADSRLSAVTPLVCPSLSLGVLPGTLLLHQPPLALLCMLCTLLQQSIHLLLQTGSILPSTGELLLEGLYRCVGSLQCTVSYFQLTQRAS